MVVVLPEPLGPKNPHTDPAGCAIETLSTATLLPNFLHKFLTSIANPWAWLIIDKGSMLLLEAE